MLSNPQHSSNSQSLITRLVTNLPFALPMLLGPVARTITDAIGLAQRSKQLDQNDQRMQMAQNQNLQPRQSAVQTLTPGSMNPPHLR